MYDYHLSPLINSKYATGEEALLEFVISGLVHSPPPQDNILHMSLRPSVGRLGTRSNTGGTRQGRI